jgi:SAM-dependent methyltransferase
MGEDRGLVPTQPTTGSEYQRWRAVFAGDEYFYGSEPGPIARRAVRYHRQFRPRGGTALDAGCGEGQDLAFLAERGYVATGIEFTETGVAKAQRLLQSRGLEAEVLQEDLRRYAPPRPFDLVLAVNAVQFLGAEADACLRKLMAAVLDGGVIGVSLFARPQGQSNMGPGNIWLVSMEELLDRFAGWQMLEAARLWQWNTRTNQPQPFVTLIARNVRVPGHTVVLP